MCHSSSGDPSRVRLSQSLSFQVRLSMQAINYSTVVIREALQCIDNSDIPDRHKRVVVAVVSHALRNAGAGAFADTRRVAGDSWEQHEVQTIAAHLAGKVAVSWQHADELVQWLVACLRRTPDDIRKKAMELGFGAGVDYRIAKSLTAPVEA